MSASRSNGTVYLVGAGPGDPELLTLRAARLLMSARLIVHDGLVDPAILAMARPGARMISVAKSRSRHSLPQAAINALLIREARAGHDVVRLKGGDPFVFGRGGEEVAACLAAGVAVDVVPGLTSVVSVPQAAGIPVTHRGSAASIHVVNGQAEVSLSTLAALADDSVTTVVLMGVAALPRLVDAALAAGVPEDRPVAIVERGHTPLQRTTRTTLGHAIADVEEAGVRNPAVIVIGEVARARLLLPDRELAGDSIR